ncbi:hypothetical protein E4U21_005574 [Claviceps maximensis]|nr:hypothetical protein E4U21_005574 [Claviceps maximensis]
MGRFSARRRPLALLALVASLLFLYHVSPAPGIHVWGPRPPVSGPPPSRNDDDLGETSELDSIGYLTKPRSIPRTDAHPIEYLSQTAEHDFSATLHRQSKTLEEAVEEYRRRYGLPPPPHFDKWFAFAKENDVELLDEFDTIHDLMTPFWGLTPGTIRSRAREALGLGRNNGLLGIAIRAHKVAFVENANGADWQQAATTDMMAKFIQYLPDMDLAFNIHDEPRVVLPHDDLARLVHKARTGDMAASFANPRPVNRFAASVPDLASGLPFAETKQTRFRSAPHQPTWTTSRMSCPPDSAARLLDEADLGDDAAQYALTDAGFVANATALADICLSPSLSHSHGFFEMPNGYIIAHDLFPIFSQSKISSYNDIIYPSPWYWSEKVVCDDAKDRPWADKHDQLYWRGSTTGGFSRGGNWKRQHRQLLVRKLNHARHAKILINNATSHPSDSDPNWALQQINRSDIDPLLNVRFSHVGQCDPDDCQAQIKYFGVGDMVDMQDAWQYKFLLDMDGNAFSGRFYAFLKSRSQVFKQALFEEWHRERLKPWVHYVPMSMRGHDWIELVRFYSGGRKSRGTSGTAHQIDRAEAMARTSTEWAGRALRKVDMEAWFFRLLLE